MFERFGFGGPSRCACPHRLYLVQIDTFPCERGKRPMCASRASYYVDIQASAVSKGNWTDFSHDTGRDDM